MVLLFNISEGLSDQVGAGVLKVQQNLTKRWGSGKASSLPINVFIAAVQVDEKYFNRTKGHVTHLAVGGTRNIILNFKLEDFEKNMCHIARISAVSYILQYQSNRVVEILESTYSDTSNVIQTAICEALNQNTDHTTLLQNEMVIK